MKLSEFVKSHDFFLDYITFYEDAINFFLDDRLKDVYNDKKLKKLLRKFLKKFEERRVVFFPTDLESAPPFVIILKKDNYEFSYEFDDYKNGDILIRTDHVTMMSIGLGSITIFRALLEERIDFYPYYPILEKFRLAKLFNLRIFF